MTPKYPLNTTNLPLTDKTECRRASVKLIES